MRIVAGTWRGRPLQSPTHGTRPTLDRARQIAFDILGQRMIGARVLDLFAGSGALGLEALSRGAQSAVFVESSAGAVRILRENIRSLGAEDLSRILQRDVKRALPALGGGESFFDWIFADPPYGGTDAVEFLRWMDASGESLLDGKGGILLEIGRRDKRPQCRSLRLVRERVVGETVLCFLSWMNAKEDDDR